MAALENLSNAVVALTQSVDAAVTVLSTPPAATEAQVQAAADAVAVQTTRLTSATPPPPTNAPAPTP